MTACEDLLIFLKLCSGYLFKVQLKKLNFYFNQVIWDILYHPLSAMDTGTLFQARNFLNAKMVPASPIKDNIDEKKEGVNGNDIECFC